MLNVTPSIIIYNMEELLELKTIMIKHYFILTIIIQDHDSNGTWK